MNPFLRKLGIELPIVQAPMAGVDTPEMAAAVSNAGGLGSVGVGSVDAEATRRMITAVRSRTDRPFNVNVFCHRPAAADAAREAAWLARLGPEVARYEAKPPTRLTEIYQSFLTDDAKLAVLVAEPPAVVSFHFGLPARERVEALRAAGIVLLATATNLAGAGARRRTRPVHRPGRRHENRRAPLRSGQPGGRRGRLTHVVDEIGLVT